MRDWSYSDWIAYPALLVGAAFLAVETAIAQSPHIRRKLPAPLKKAAWGFVPLVLLSTTFIIWITQTVGFLDHLNVGSMKFAYKDTDIKKLEVVRDQTFRNEKVVVDGKSFEDCVFVNVTFVYNGTDGFAISHNHFNGVSLSSENPAVLATVAILKGIGALKKDVPVLLPGARIDPPIENTQP